MPDCYQESCPNWSGDGRVCPCVLMGIEPEDGPGARQCRTRCVLDPDDEERHRLYGGCLDADDIAELKLQARDYESWARL